MTFNLKGWKFPEWIPKPPILPGILILIALILGIRYAEVNYFSPKEKSLEVPVVLAQINPEVIKEVKVDVPLKTPTSTIKAYKPAVKNTIPLPAAVLGDVDKYVTSSVSVDGSEKRKVVSTVIDVATGESTTYIAPVPSPWFSFEHRGYAALDYGFKRNSSNPVARLNVREDLVQIKEIHLGLTGSIHSDGDYFVGMGGEYRW